MNSKRLLGLPKWAYGGQRRGHRKTEINYSTSLVLKCCPWMKTLAEIRLRILIRNKTRMSNSILDDISVLRTKPDKLTLFRILVRQMDYLYWNQSASKFKFKLNSYLFRFSTLKHQFCSEIYLHDNLVKKRKFVKC